VRGDDWKRHLFGRVTW